MPMPNPNAGMPQPHAAGLYGAPPPMPQPGGGYPSSGHLSFGVSMLFRYTRFYMCITYKPSKWPTAELGS